ncbi:S-adenosyl-L-methionine-dependent methyltransferase [Daldinia sp. FL1419]|nr:S-adenosyl-L-methionine-dependent methyltransferase [Daldinia sp. FL1419]
MSTTMVTETTSTGLGSGIYTQSLLNYLYQRLVLEFNVPYVWGCPCDVLLNLFAEHFSQNHLDCGVATGYFPATILRRTPHANSQRQITLLDLNPNCLEAAKAAIVAEAPQVPVHTVEADIKAPIPAAIKGKKFDTISMFNLFHCVPGGASKFQALATYKDALADDGVFIGCTVLGEKHATGWFSRNYLSLYNWVGVFNNWDDKAEDVERVLRSAYKEVEVWKVGMMLMWRVRGPKKA